MGWRAATHSLAGWLSRMRPQRWFGRFEAMADADIEAMMSWGITSELAAVPVEYLQFLPPDVASLVHRAKDLHQVVARAQARQVAEIATRQIGFAPVHHVFRTLGVCAGNYVALPAGKAPVDLGEEALNERTRILEALIALASETTVCDPWGGEPL